MTRRVVITGANRGIGLALTGALVASGDRVVAGCRRPDDADALQRLAPEVVLPVDLADETSIETFAGGADRHFGSVDLLINNAGIDARSVGVADDGRGPMRIPGDAVLDVMRVNTVGPLLLIRALAPALSRPDTAMVVNVSSQIGSMVVGAHRGGDVAYNTSKAALNMVTVMMADRLARHDIGVVAVHPGWIRTDMGGPAGDLDLDEAVPPLVRLLAGLTLADTGRFLDPNGADHPW